MESIYREIPEGVNLDLVFSIRQPGKVNKDNTISLEGSIYQIIPSNGIQSFAGKWVEVARRMDGGIEILYDSKRLTFLELKKEEYRHLKEKDILSKREYKEARPRRWEPPQNHPWRRRIPKNSNHVTFQNRNYV